MTLEDHLRKATRNFTLALPEEQVLALARDLLRELARAHAENPPRHPALEPSAIAMEDGQPRLAAAATGVGSNHEDLFRLGALVNALALGRPADVSWRLDGPPPLDVKSLARRAALSALGSPLHGARVESAEAALRSFEAALATSTDAAAPWPLFRGDPGRSGTLSRPEPRGLRPLWSAALGPVVASPVVHGSFVICATADGRLAFLDRDSGRSVHELKLASAIESSPALHAGRLYVGTDDGECACVEVGDGRALWKAKLGDVVRSSPLVHEDKVLVGVIEGKGGSLVALDAAKGKLLWKRKLGGPVFSSPALHQGLAFVGSDDGSVHAVDVLKGEPAWSHALGGKVRATPAVMGDRVLAADFAGRVCALAPKDGARAWLRETGAAIYSSPCAASGVVLVGNNDGVLLGSELETGAARFELATRGPVVASALALGGRFLIGSTDGALYLLDAQGTLVERTPLANGGIQSTPAVALNALFVGTHDGVRALELLA
jgi:eukaryotic-like serine/threonine-protein kinase